MSNSHQDPNNNNNNNNHNNSNNNNAPHRRGATVGFGGRLFIRVKKDRNFDFYTEDSPYSIANRQQVDTARTQFRHKIENDDGSGNNTNTGYMNLQQQQEQQKDAKQFTMPQPELQPIIDFMNAQNGYHRSIVQQFTSNNNENGSNNNNNEEVNENFLNVANQVQGGQIVFRLVNNNQNENDNEQEQRRYERENQNNSQYEDRQSTNENSNTQHPQGTFQCTSVACSQRGDVVLEFNFNKSENNNNNSASTMPSPSAPEPRSSIAQSMIKPHLTENENNNHDSNQKKSVRFLPKRQSSQQVTLEQKRYRQQMESSAKGEFFCDVDLSDDDDDDNDNEDENENHRKLDQHDDANQDILQSRPIRERTNQASPKSILKSMKNQAKKSKNDNDEYLLFEAVTVIPSSSKGENLANRFGQTNSRTVYRKVEEVEENDHDEPKFSKNDKNKATKTTLSREDAYNYPSSNNNNLASFSLDPSSAFPATFEEMRPELQLELECIDEMMWDPGDETIGRREQEIFRALRTTSTARTNYYYPSSGDNRKNSSNLGNKSSFDAYYSKYFNNMQQAQENERNIAFSRGELVVDQDQLTSDMSEEGKRELQHLMRSSGNTKHQRDQRENLTNAISAGGKNGGGGDRLARADDDYDSNAESENDGDYGSSSEDDDNCQVCGDEDIFENDDLDGLPAVGKRARLAGNKTKRNNNQDDDDGDDEDDDDDDENTATSSTIEHEHDDAGGFTNADDDGDLDDEDDVPPNQQRRGKRSINNGDRRQILSMQNQFGHLPGFSAASSNKNNDVNDHNRRTIIASGGARVGQDGAVAENNNDDEFALDGFEDDFEDFDPFNDHDNDPHVFLDREGNAYVRETPW